MACSSCGGSKPYLSVIDLEKEQLMVKVKKVRGIAKAADIRAALEAEQAANAALEEVNTPDQEEALLGGQPGSSSPEGNALPPITDDELPNTPTGDAQSSEGNTSGQSEEIVQ
jgi:hypothetical protein